MLAAVDHVHPLQTSVDGLAAVGFVGLSLAATLTSTGSGIPAVNAAGPVVKADPVDRDPVCYPLGMEVQCDTCEYNEEWSEYYGEDVWMCA